jgi:hypothetical protein
MSKKKTFKLLLFVIALLMSACMGKSISLTNADPIPPPSPLVTIGSDGSISPSSAPINKTGSLYTLTKDLIEYRLTIECSNITFDGDGHTLQGKGYFDGSVMIHRYDPAGLTIRANGVTVKNTNINGYSEYCIDARGSCVAIIRNNVTDGNIGLAGGFSNVTGNTISNSNIILDTSYNMIVGNTLIQSCIVFRASDNSVYLNNFLNSFNPIWFETQSEGNVFDNGSMGNYWDRYKGVDVDGDGVGDMPYEALVSTDEYYTFDHPLMKPVDILKVLDPYPPALIVLSPQNTIYYNDNFLLTFTVDELTSWMGYSLDGQDNITITSNSTINELTSGLHNVTVYAKDTFGNEGTSETVFFTVDVPEPFPTTLVAAASVAAAVVVGAVLLVYFKKRKR